MKWRVWIEPRAGGFLVRSRNGAGRNGLSQVVSTKSLANEVKKLWQHRLEREGLGLIDPNRSAQLAFKEYLSELEHAGQNNYRISMQAALGPYLRDKPNFGDLTTESILAYRTFLIGKLAMPTVRSRLRHVSAFLSWCVSKKYLTESPFKGIPIPDYVPRPKFMTDEEIAAIDRAATGELKLMWRLAYTTGLRQANILELRGDQIEHGMAIISRTKGKRPISAPLSPLVLKLLPKPLPKGPLFAKWDRWTLRWAFGLLKVNAGVRRGITWHMARHTFIKKALQSGLTTFEVMKFTGHVSPVSMVPYANFEMDRLRERHGLIRFPSGGSGQISGHKVGK